MAALAVGIAVISACTTSRPSVSPGLNGQRTAATFSHVHRPTAPSCAPPWHGRAADVVDVPTGERFSRRALSCVAIDPTTEGLIGDGKFYDVVPIGWNGSDPTFRIVAVDLKTFRSVLSPTFRGTAQLASMSLGQLWVDVNGSAGPQLDWQLVDFSPTTLRATWRVAVPDIGAAPLGTYLWVGDGHLGLLRLEPAKRLAVRVPVHLRPRSYVEQVSANASVLYLSVVGDIAADNAVVRYDPRSGSTRSQ